LLYVGDCKMGALETRAGVQAGGDFYLCPLSAVQVPPVLLSQYLAEAWASGPALPVERPQADGTMERIAEGYERSQSLTAVLDTWPHTWVERRVLVRSHTQARTAETALRARLAHAQAALAHSPRPRPGTEKAAPAAPVPPTAGTSRNRRLPVRSRESPAQPFCNHRRRATRAAADWRGHARSRAGTAGHRHVRPTAHR
jgi:hypothetical protein